MNKLLCSLLALGLAACGGAAPTPPADQLAANDFEHLDGWLNGNTPASLTQEKAHSGVYSVKVDPATDYSLGYTNQLGRISTGRMRKIKLRAWVFLPNDQATAALVTEIKTPDPTKNLWDNFDLGKEATTKSGFNKWLEVEHTVDVPATAVFNSTLQVYLWRNGSSQPVYLDDLQILRAD